MTTPTEERFCLAYSMPLYGPEQKTYPVMVAVDTATGKAVSARLATNEEEDRLCDKPFEGNAP